MTLDEIILRLAERLDVHRRYPRWHWFTTLRVAFKSDSRRLLETWALVEAELKRETHDIDTLAMIIKRVHEKHPEIDYDTLIESVAYRLFAKERARSQS